MAELFGVRHWISRPSFLLLVLGLALSMVPISDLGTNSFAEAVLAQSTLVLFVMAPAVALAAAWESSRFRDFADFRRGFERKLLVDRLLPLSLPAPAAFVLAVVVTSEDLQFLGRATFWLLLVYIAIAGLCWVLIGAALGWTLTPLLAIALAGASAYLWYAVIPSTPFGPVRRATGDFLACCSTDAELSRLAIVAGLLGIASFTLVVWTTTMFVRRGPSRVSAAVAVVAALSVLASVITSHKVPQYGVVSRPTEEIKCVDGVCAWPETPPQSFDLNRLAHKQFGNISPQSWHDFAATPVKWGPPSDTQLAFSGATSVEGVLGDFVDQAGARELIRRDVPLCGTPMSEIGYIRSGIAWPQGKQATLADVEARLRQSHCPPGEI